MKAFKYHWYLSVVGDTGMGWCEGTFDRITVVIIHYDQNLADQVMKHYAFEEWEKEKWSYHSPKLERVTVHELKAGTII